MPLASARQHPENQKENQAGKNSSERTVQGQGGPTGPIQHPPPCARWPGALGSQNAKSTTNPGLIHRYCPREFSRSATRNVMIQFSVASLAYARQPGFSALLFSDVKPPTGLLAAYKQPAADDLQQMGLAVLTDNIISLASLLVRARSAPRWRSSRNPMAGLTAGSGR